MRVRARERNWEGLEKKSRLLLFFPHHIFFKYASHLAMDLETLKLIMVTD
jgi:hypothetical protein